MNQRVLLRAVGFVKSGPDDKPGAINHPVIIGNLWCGVKPFHACLDAAASMALYFPMKVIVVKGLKIFRDRSACFPGPIPGRRATRCGRLRPEGRHGARPTKRGGSPLAKLPALDGKIITANPLQCQRKTARAIVEKGGDYHLQIKGNQPKLFRRAHARCPQELPMSCASERATEKTGVRIRSRK